MSIASADDVWAVGGTDTTDDGTTHPVLLHEDGNGWSVVEGAG